MKYKFKKILVHLLRLNNSPREIALGVALGVFICILPVYGLHTVLAIIAAILVRPANKIAILLGTSVSLPPTVPFITWAGYEIGRLIFWGRFDPLSWKFFKDITLQKIVSHYQPLFFGSVILGLVCAVLFYFVTLLIVRKINVRKKQKLGDASVVFSQNENGKLPKRPLVFIRKFEPRDRQQVRAICYDTAFMGEPASVFFDGREVISDALSLYFTDFEPESCFVAEVNREVVGYLMGAKSKAASDIVIKNKIMLPLLWKALKTGVFLKRKNIIFIFSCLSGMFNGGHATPDFSEEYPATLHINLKKEFRGQSIGVKLMTAFLDYLKNEKIYGLHLATMSEKGAEFFSKQGFELLFEGRRTYFRHILHRDVPLYIFGHKNHCNKIPLM